jgi:tRNA U55 pseudouridine synthase TruB
MSLLRYVIIEKKVGETPLSAMEAWRQASAPTYNHVPLAYAGRLDPLASGRLLVLIGNECKVQEMYHTLDKQYEFSVLLGVGSDTGDVMGRLSYEKYSPTLTTKPAIRALFRALSGQQTFTYPVFSSRTVAGKPLHTWAAEGRLAEITIPTYTAMIHSLTFTDVVVKSREIIYQEALEKINTIPPVTEVRKALGNDFRRTDIRTDWQTWLNDGQKEDQFTILYGNAVVSCGLYIRNLAPLIGQRLGTNALAYHIHRTTIGHYQPIPFSGGFWRKKY